MTRKPCATTAKKHSSRFARRVNKKLPAPWKINDAGTVLTGEFQFISSLEAFMFITRVVVHAQVLHQEPHLTMYRNNVVVSLIQDSEVSITPLQLTFAARICTLLSTARPTKGK